jgi:hypothetical protein
MASTHFNKLSFFGLRLALVLLAALSLLLLIVAAVQAFPLEISIGDPGSSRSFQLVFERVDTLLQQLETESAVLYPDDPHLNLVDEYS